MKTGLHDTTSFAEVASIPIVALAGQDTRPNDVAHELANLARARTFVEPLLAAQRLDTGENALSHAEGVVTILQAIGARPALQTAAYLVYAADYLTQPEKIITQAFGLSEASLVSLTQKLVQVQRNARGILADEYDGATQFEQIERVRKMLLAFAQDLRVVLLRLASRLQTLRYYAASKKECPKLLARESLQVFAPLANRLGIWQIKWELEDLSFRFLYPDDYQKLARSLRAKRIEREKNVDRICQLISQKLAHAHIAAHVYGRPKHLYSIWKKMQGKRLPLDKIFDLQALRILVDTTHDCYAALGCLHESWTPLTEEFVDYIVRPKANGYQSLHTVVLDASARPIEVQIRTHAMHDYAESGVAAHWAYKEAGPKGYAGVQSEGSFETQVTEARKTILRQLLAWERDLAQGETQVSNSPTGKPLFKDRTYVFTPQGNIIDLPAGATPIDFAYAVHTDLGHRCRGARIDGVIVPLDRVLQSGQTIEILPTKDPAAGPSLDWLNPELQYLQSSRAKTKVRAWFNALAQRQTILKGRDLVSKFLQKEGQTALKLEDLATQLGFRTADALFEVIGKDEFSIRNLENLFRPTVPVQPGVTKLTQRMNRVEQQTGKASTKNQTGIMVVGLDSLLTQLARCCKPAPPDPIGGYITRGKGVAVHRQDCSNFRQMIGRQPERAIAVQWKDQPSEVGPATQLYPVDISVQAQERAGLLQDLCDAVAKEKNHVIAMQTQAKQDRLQIILTIQMSNVKQLNRVLHTLLQVPDVLAASRR